jgi:hypothetical protein
MQSYLEYGKDLSKKEPGTQKPYGTLPSRENQAYLP